MQKSVAEPQGRRAEQARGDPFFPWTQETLLFHRNIKPLARDKGDSNT